MVLRRRGNKNNVLSKRVKKAIKKIAFSTQETKHHRVSEDIAFANVGTLVQLNTVNSQGVASGQFVGQEIYQMWLKLRGLLTQADSSNVTRVVIFTPTMEGERLISGGANVNDMFYSTTGSDSLYSYFRESLTKKIYYDKIHILNIANGQNDKTTFVKLFIDLKMKKYKVHETSPTGSDIIYLGLISDSGMPSDPVFNFESFLAYKDA